MTKKNWKNKEKTEKRNERRAQPLEDSDTAEDDAKPADVKQGGDKAVCHAEEKQFEAGRLFAVISSRPGQSGRCDGYILEGEELAFYQRQLRK